MQPGESQYASHPPPRTSWWRRAWRAGRAAASGSLVAAILILVVAHVVGDRAMWLQFCLYTPLWAVALTAIGWDLLNLGKALPLRFLLSMLGLGLGVMSIGMMWAPARAPEGDSSQSGVTLVQWNMQWGGLAGPASLEKVVSTVLAHDPQIVCLTEVPPQSYFGHYWKEQAGPGWHAGYSAGSEQYMSRMGVLSKSPVQRVGQWLLDHGEAALFEVAIDDAPAKPFRILMVDIESEPSLPRSPSIEQAARIVEAHAVAGTPIDIVAGDFNTPARFLGFKTLANAGERYERASLWSGQWRATWPARLVVPFRGSMREIRHTWRLSTFDIDHIWVRSGLDVASASIFTTDVVDHRGQVCQLRLPKREP